MSVFSRNLILSLKNTPMKLTGLRAFSLHQNPQENHYDIIVAGGGMVGTTLACMLGRNSRLAKTKILLLEGSKEQNYVLPEKYSNRVSALNQSTVNLMKGICAWDHITASRYGVVNKMQVWDAISDTMITFEKDDDNVVAYIVENDLLLSAVGKELKKNKNVRVLYEAKIKKFNLAGHENDISCITLENGSSFTCNLLLGCDGANSEIRKTMGVHYLSWSYEQMGVVATLHLKSEYPDNNTAWQRFLPSGPIALLPLNKDMSSLVWSTSIKHAKELLRLPDDQFVNAVNEAIWKSYKRHDIIEKSALFLDNFLGYLNCPPNSQRQLPPTVTGCQKDSRAGFPLGFGHASSYIAKGVVLVGDSAHRVHPLAGQGVNLGFGDVICLNKILGDAVYAGSKIDNMIYLRQYESQRQKHNLPTMMAIDGLHRLYNCDWTPAVLLRSLGLQVTNAITPLKKAMMAQAAH